MNNTQYGYAICREYHGRALEETATIIVGLEREPIIVSKEDIIKANSFYAVRFSQIGRKKHLIIGSIRDTQKRGSVTRTIPLDDLVREKEDREHALI